MPNLPVLARVQFVAFGAFLLFAALGGLAIRIGHARFGHFMFLIMALALYVVASINDWGKGG